jgi:hypothetical protein
MSNITGAISGIALGVIVIAGIYQLNKKGSPLVPAATGVANHTLTSIFK